MNWLGRLTGANRGPEGVEAGNGTASDLAVSRLDVARARSYLARYAIGLILVLQIILWTFLSPYFLTLGNITDIARQSSIIGISAVGMTFCVIAGSIDLSVSNMIAFSGMMAAYLFQLTNSPLLAWTLATVLGILIGVAVGLIIARLRLSAFIVTLALFAILGALALIFKDGYSIDVADNNFRYPGIGSLGPVPVLVVVFAAVAIGGHWVLSNTPFGRRVYAIGGNPDAALYSGVSVERHMVAVHTIVAGLSAFAGVMLAARLGAGTPEVSTATLLDIIAAVIIGGTSIFGGVGTIWGTIVGVLFLTTLTNGLTLINVSGYYQMLATGGALLGAVVLDRLFYAQPRE